MAQAPILVAVKPLKAQFREFSTITLNAEEFTLGRSLGSSAVIAFISLSRKHCVFRRKTDDTWSIEDFSAFGISINNKKLGKGSEHHLSNNDILQLEPTGEFIYKFVNTNCGHSDDPPSKKLKIEDEAADILKDAKQMFEESQSFEVESLEKKIKNAQQLQTTSIMMKRQLEAEMEKKIHDLNEGFEVQIENLKGEKQEVERQKAELQRERDDRLADMRSEMDNKITELRDQISRHNETEKGLVEENSALKERLEREREQFLAELRESAGREELLLQLQEKCRQQEETRLREKLLLEESLKRESEQQRIALEQTQARAEAERKLREAHESTEKSLESLKKQVADKEVELSMLAEQRVQEEALRSNQKVSVLQEELDKVKTELECEKIVRLFSSDVGAGGSGEEGPAVRTHFGELLESELQCTICADLLIAAVTLNCSHTFCKYCIGQWKKKKKDCPICRTFITSECRSLVIDSFIEKMVANLNDEMKQKRLQILKDREELETETSNVGVAGTSRGGGGDGDTSASDSGSEGTGRESDGSAQGWSSQNYDEGDDFDFDGDYDYDSPWYYSNRHYRNRHYDSGSDEESSDGESSPNTPTNAGANGNNNGEPGTSGATGGVGSGTDGAGAAGSSAPNTNTTSRSRSRRVIRGIPGSYYGGYGRCYSCGARGHWAPGCPFN